MNAQGRYSVATNPPIAAAPTPRRRISLAIAVAVNPSGMPSVTYSMKNAASRPQRVASRFNMAGECNVRPYGSRMARAALVPSPPYSGERVRVRGGPVGLRSLPDGPSPRPSPPYTG